MKIALVSGSFSPHLCGVAHYSARIAEEFAARGIKVTVLTTKQAQRSIEQHSAYEVIGVVDNWSSAQIPALLLSLGKLYPDIIHIQHSASSYGHKRDIGIIPLLVRLSRWKARIVVTAHEYGGWEMKHRLLPPALLDKVMGIAERRGAFDREDLFLLTWSDKVLVTNVHHFNYIRARMPSLSRKLELLPIGANVLLVEGDRERTRSEARQLWEVGPDNPLIVYFGFIHPVKGLETLLNAFARVRKENPTAKLVMAGGFYNLSLPGEEADIYRRKLEGLIVELGLGESARFSGFLPNDEVSKLLMAADLCVLPFNPGVSLKSGSLMAALVHGLPVVTTGGESVAPELVNGENILLVPPRDSGALASAMSLLLSSAPLRQKLAQGGLTLAERFSWEGIVERHVSIYSELGGA